METDWAGGRMRKPGNGIRCQEADKKFRETKFSQEGKNWV